MNSVNMPTVGSTSLNKKKFTWFVAVIFFINAAALVACSLFLIK